MVQERDDVVLIDAAILGPPQVWEASGHLANFTDPLVDCTNCKQRFRLDKLDDPNTCPNCGKHGTFTEARQFNLMFKTHAGPVEDSGAVAYLRPETAQGMFVNFANVLQTTRKKPPFGIAQVGKSFRNEITPQNWIFRTREFEQMEMQFFVPPADGAAVVRVLVRRAPRLVRPPRHPPRPAAPAARTTPTSCRTTRPARPTSSSASRGASTSSRASPSAPTTTSSSTAPALRREARLLRPGRRTSATRRTSSSRPPAPPGRWRRSCCRPTTSTRSTARSARCCASTRASRRTRSPCCRCRRRTR